MELHELHALGLLAVVNGTEISELGAGADYVILDAASPAAVPRRAVLDEEI